MPYDYQPSHSKTRGSSRNSSDVILEIGRPGKETRQFPAVIRNLRAGLVSLEVTYKRDLKEWEDLKGQARPPVHTSQRERGTRQLPRGRWFGSATSPEAGTKACLAFDLALGRPTAAAQKVLNKHIPVRERDIQELWERWDQARQPDSQRTAVSFRLGLVGVTLLLCGLFMNTGGAEPHPLLALTFWLMGTLGVLGQILLLWKGIKNSI